MKKVLAWAVALALVLSSFTMAFAADTGKTSKDFSDADQIHYTEAVDVMVATGIINGYPDGTFGPAKTVNRAEMAKMIACIMNSGEDIGDQYKSTCPFADSKDHWAAGYIAYCASEHIIDGRSADVFDPKADVTGTEVAKMALTSLGYDSKIQGYTGENWAANVLKDAKKNDLFKGLDKSFVPGDPCDRESAAQILFNMLKATEVQYNNNTSISVGDDTQVVVSSKAEPVANTGKTDDNGDKLMQLYEDVFGGDLTKKASTTSDGKPAHKWTYQKEEVGEYPDAPADSIVAEEDQTVKEALEDINEDYSAGKVFLNGDEGYTGGIEAGDIVETFETSTEDVYDVTIMRYQLAKVTAIDTNVTAKDLKADKNLTAYVFINGQKYFDTKVVGYDAATYEEDAYIAVAFNGAGDVIDSYLAETAQGEMTKWTDTAITLDDKDYNKSGVYDQAYDPKGELVAKTDAGKTIDVYFDKNEYVLGAFVVPEDDDTQIALFTDYTRSMKASDEYAINNITLMDAAGEETDYSLTNKGTQAVMEGDVIGTASSIGYWDIPLLVKYELNDNNKVKNVIYWDEDFGTIYNGESGEKVSKRGLVDGKLLAEDVVAFYFDEPEATSDEDGEWVIYKYEDLLEATIFDAEYVLNSDGEIAYMYLSKDIKGSADTTTVLGFYVDKSAFSDTDGDKVTVNLMLPDGSQKDYTAKASVVSIDLTKADPKTLIKVVQKGDEITEISDGYAALNAPADEWVDDGFIIDTVKVTKASKGTIWLSSGTEYIGDANVYKVNYDADKKVDSISKSKADSIAANDMVILMQLDKDSEGWDTVLYWTGADQDMLDTYSVTVNAGEGGTAVASPTSGKARTEITITVTPDDGYAIKSVKNGDTELTGSEGEYTFTLGTADATITVEFEAIPEPTPEPTPLDPTDNPVQP